MRRLGLTLAGLLLLAGCSGSRPSEGEGQRAIEEQIRRDSNGLIRLDYFGKTNGQEMESGGTKAYRMEFRASIEFLDDCMWSGAEPAIESSSFSAVRGRPQNALEGFSPAFMGRKPISKGTSAALSGFIVFEKTEAGWRAVHVGNVAVLWLAAASRGAAQREAPATAPAPTRRASARSHDVELGAIQAPIPMQAAMLLFFDQDEPSGRTQRRRETTVFTTDFDRARATYVGWWLEVKYAPATVQQKAIVEATFSNEAGVLLGSQQAQMDIRRGWASSYVYNSWGWSQPGQWPVGTYHLVLRIQGQVIARGSFQVH